MQAAEKEPALLGRTALDLLLSFRRSGLPAPAYRFPGFPGLAAPFASGCQYCIPNIPNPMTLSAIAVP